jgi:hypothetical protein
VAQIVSGIGFIGGGLIFVRRDAVRGLTTAAVIWLTAAVGMAAGAGLWLLAVAATAGTCHRAHAAGGPAAAVEVGAVACAAHLPRRSRGAPRGSRRMHLPRMPASAGGAAGTGRAVAAAGPAACLTENNVAAFTSSGSECYAGR